jgi:hypothetical protein
LLSFVVPSDEERRFARLKKEVEAPSTTEQMLDDTEAIFSGARTSDDALEEFVTLLAARSEINEVLHRHGWIGVSGKGGNSKLKELYWMLSINGAGGIVVGNIYVPTACLYDPRLLEYVLSMEAEGVSAVDIASNAVNVVEQKTGRSWRPN